MWGNLTRQSVDAVQVHIFASANASASACKGGCSWDARAPGQECTCLAPLHCCTGCWLTLVTTAKDARSAQNMCWCWCSYRCIEQRGCTDKLQNARIFSGAGRTSHHIPYTTCWLAGTPQSQADKQPWTARPVWDRVPVKTSGFSQLLPSTVEHGTDLCFFIYWRKCHSEKKFEFTLKLTSGLEPKTKWKEAMTEAFLGVSKDMFP